MNAPTPRKASTVIVVRDPLKVLLMQRSTHDSFMAKATVYPGGAVDETDASGFFFAAIRELFEEAFILFAKRISGEALNFSAEPELSRFKEYRKAIHDNKITLVELAQKEGLIYTPDALTPFAHWITPVIQKTRFDTWFFLAELPEGQVAYHDNKELTGTDWMMAKDALTKNAAGEIKLMPPTLMTLTELASFNSVNELFMYA
jgi:8-oxo-dGTP pyrophosphatase MutT (NUDIX family)